MITLIDPHSAYIAYTKGLQHKFSYTMRTIPGAGELLNPLEDTILHQLIPAITEHQNCSSTERQLLSLPVRLGGLGITNPSEEADQEFENSSKLTTALTNAIIDQSTTTVKNDNEMRKVV